MEDKRDEVTVLSTDIEQSQKEEDKQNNKEQKQQDNDDKKKTIKTVITTIICTLLFIIILLLLIILGLKKCASDNNGTLPNSSEPDSSIKYDYDVNKIDDVFKKIVKNQLIVDGFDEDPLKDVISVTYSDTTTSFNLNIEVRSDTKVYYYRLSNFPYSGFDNFVPYLLSLDLNTKLSLNEGSISLDTYLPTLETITTDKSSYKYLISTNYSGTDKFFSGFYFENNEYRAYIHKPLTGDPFYQNADLIVDKNNPLYTYYQKLNSVVS